MRFLVVLLLFFPFMTSAQPLSLPRFALVGVEEGLSRGLVTDMFQDKRGYFWIGTTDGLNRYDGEEIKIYRPDPDPNLRSHTINRVRSNMCEDENGNIWYVNESGIYCCNPARVRVEKFAFPDAFQPGPDIRGILICPDSTMLWMFDYKNGLIRYQYAAKDRKIDLFPLPLAVDKAAAPPQADDKEKILIPTGTENGLLVFDTKTLKFETFFKGTPVIAAFFQPGIYYLQTPVSIIRSYTFQRAAETWAVQAGGGPNSPVLKVTEDRAGRVWACTATDGLWYYERRQKKWSKCVVADPFVRLLPPNELTDIYLDHAANLWIGTKNEGVCRLDTKNARFNTFPPETGYRGQLKDRSVSSIYEQDDKTVWFGVKSGGLYHWDAENGKLDFFRAGLVNLLFKDRENRLWAGQDKGLGIFDPKTGNWHPAAVPPEFALAPGEIWIYKMIQTRQGDLVAATLKGLATVRPSEKNNWIVNRASDTSSDLLIDVVETPNGDIWAVGPQTGLHGFRRNSEGVFQSFGQYLNNFELAGLHLDEKDSNLLWLPTAVGLIRFDLTKRAYQIFSQTDGLPYRFLHSITEDARHDLWMSGESGICRMQRSNNRNAFYSYNASDGLMQTEFNAGVFHRGGSGTLYFGGPRGFSYFSPQDSQPIRQKPFIAIDQIYVNERLVSADSGTANIPVLRLSTTENDLNFRFAALDFTRPSANKIQYTLEGRDDSWFTTARERMVRYTNLPPGLYTLRVKAGNGQGVWSEEKQLKIFIDAPFWRSSNIFILLWIALSGLAFWWFTAQNTKKYREQLAILEKQRAVEAERNRIAKDMHDEIGSGLSQIALMTELLSTEKMHNERSRNYARDIGGNARKLVQSISEIIWALNPQQDSLDSLLAYIREQTYSFFEPFESVMHYEINFPDAVPHHELGNQQRRNLYLVAKEALNNALKHGKAKNISLTFVYQLDKVRFTVRDDGRGLDPTRKSTGGGFGLPNMRRRMEEIGGGINWKSEGGAGTEVEFWMPI